MVDGWFDGAGTSKVLQARGFSRVAVSGIPLHLRSDEALRNIARCLGESAVVEESGGCLNEVRIRMRSQDHLPEGLWMTFGRIKFWLTVTRLDGVNSVTGELVQRASRGRSTVRKRYQHSAPARKSLNVESTKDVGASGVCADGNGNDPPADSSPENHSGQGVPAVGGDSEVAEGDGGHASLSDGMAGITLSGGSCGASQGKALDCLGVEGSSRLLGSYWARPDFAFKHNSGLNGKDGLELGSSQFQETQFDGQVSWVGQKFKGGARSGGLGPEDLFNSGVLVVSAEIAPLQASIYQLVSDSSGGLVQETSSSPCASRQMMEGGVSPVSKVAEVRGEEACEDAEQATLCADSIKIAEILNIRRDGSEDLATLEIMSTATKVMSRRKNSKKEMELKRLNWSGVETVSGRIRNRSGYVSSPSSDESS
ncbi:hypothetical protein LINPERPRIM_LOCUS18178 [Linum perenne]